MALMLPATKRLVRVLSETQTTATELTKSSKRPVSRPLRCPHDRGNPRTRANFASFSGECRAASGALHRGYREVGGGYLGLVPTDLDRLVDKVHDQLGFRPDD